MRVLALIGAFFAIAVPVAAQRARQADLVVTAGSVKAHGHAFVVSSTVRNQGHRTARDFSVGLSVRANGHRRAVNSYTVRRLGAGKTITVRLKVKAPAGLSAGAHALRACADHGSTVHERSEDNNCRRVGTLTVPKPTSAATPTTSVPTDPIAFKKDTVLTPSDVKSNYWLYVPTAYDASNKTSMPLLVWLHGCERRSSSDITLVSPGGSQSYLAIAVDGREGGCWNPDTDQHKVLDAIANVKTHFNVDPHHVVIAGFSSGGDLAYRTAFYHANTFAGLLAMNTTPFRDTGSTQQDSIAAAAWKFHIVHLAHTQDDQYPLATVRKEIQALKDAGFPVTYLERPGYHEDSKNDPDLKQVLLPHMDDDWRSP